MQQCMGLFYCPKADGLDPLRKLENLILSLPIEWAFVMI